MRKWMTSLRMAGGCFVTGTDTGVGKTAVAGGLAGALRRRGMDAGVMKPVQTGVTRAERAAGGGDGGFLLRAAGLSDPPDLVTPVCLEAPLAPSVAAEIEGTAVSFGMIDEAFWRLRGRHEFLVVEGAGGLAVPVTGRVLMADLALRFRLPVLVVARPGLGTINHTVLTVEFARARGLTVAGVVINGFPVGRDGVAERTNPVVIADLADVPVLGTIPHDPAVDVTGGRPGGLVELFLDFFNWESFAARCAAVAR